MNTIRPGPKIEAENIPQYQLDRLAAPLLKIVAKAFEDPQIVKEFEEWQKTRKNNGGASA